MGRKEQRRVEEHRVRVNVGGGVARARDGYGK